MSVVKEMCLWIRKELWPENPIHFSRFYPFYKLRSLPATPVSTPEKARSVALSCGLEYLYVRNIPGHEGENAFCPKCKKMIIQPTSYMVGEVSLKGEKVPIAGNPSVESGRKPERGEREVRGNGPLDLTGV